MGLIGTLIGTFFGNGNKALQDTIEVFRENAEQSAERGQALRLEVLKQYAREMDNKSEGLFDRIMNGVNRIPRPALALGTLGLFIAAMVDPIWFAARMQGIALVPEPLWWLLGVIVSFYFGARYQVKTQEFQKSIAQTVSMVPTAVENIGALQALRPTSPGVADTGPDARLSTLSVLPEANSALEEWRKSVPKAATM
jgi:hypothetical protein